MSIKIGKLSTAVKAKTQVGAIDDVPQKLAILRKSVRAGELDACMASITTSMPSAKKAKAESASPKASAAKSARCSDG